MVSRARRLAPLRSPYGRRRRLARGCSSRQTPAGFQVLLGSAQRGLQHLKPSTQLEQSSPKTSCSCPQSAPHRSQPASSVNVFTVHLFLLLLPVLYPDRYAESVCVFDNYIIISQYYPAESFLLHARVNNNLGPDYRKTHSLLCCLLPFEPSSPAAHALVMPMRTL